MPTRTLSQVSFFDPRFADPDCLEPGTVPWLLAQYRSELFPAWLFKGWRGEGRLGRNAWPAVVLMTLVVLRWDGEGMSRRASVKQAKHNTQWRAAMGLQIGAPTPDEKTVRDFERFLARHHADIDSPRYLVLHEHLVRVCKSERVLTSNPVWAMDSTPMWCYGAVQDTVRLMGDGVRRLGLWWARMSGQSVEDLAELLELPLLVAKSTKGSLSINWRDPDERAAVVDGLATRVLEVVRLFRKQAAKLPSKGVRRALRLCRNLLKVVKNDLVADEQGRLVVAHRVTSDRLVSMTDAQARHGRKSRSRTFNGFKVHVLGDVVSGVIASLTVTSGNVHDGTPAHRLISRAKKLCDDLDLVLADTAYGGATLRHKLSNTLGVELLSPPPPVSTRSDKLTKADFLIDCEAGSATCPNGITIKDPEMKWSSHYKCHVPSYKWPREVCRICPLRASARCGKGSGCHRIHLHPHERELREAREAWKRPEVREAYRTRSQCERLVNQITRHGGRRARAWGLKSANVQAHLIAMRCNLGLLARKLAEREEELKKSA